MRGHQHQRRAKHHLPAPVEQLQLQRRLQICVRLPRIPSDGNDANPGRFLVHSEENPLLVCDQAFTCPNGFNYQTGNAFTSCTPVSEVNVRHEAQAGGTLVAEDAASGGSEIVSDSAVSLNATVYFKARANPGLFISEWSGIGVGNSCNSGPAATGEVVCPVHAYRPLNVQVSFGESILYEGTALTLVGQTVAVERNFPGAGGARLRFQMKYAGRRRGLETVFSDQWTVTGQGGGSGGPGEPLTDTRLFDENLAGRFCRGRWRPPALGEIIGAVQDGAGPFEVNRLGGATPNPDDAPAGAYLGMTVAVPAAAVGAATLAPADAFYDLDSQALDGDFAAVRFHADSDGIRFPSGGAFRLVMCVRDTAESVSSPSLAAVRFETAQAAGGLFRRTSIACRSRRTRFRTGEIRTRFG